MIFSLSWVYFLGVQGGGEVRALGFSGCRV